MANEFVLLGGIYKGTLEKQRRQLYGELLKQPSTRTSLELERVQRLLRKIKRLSKSSKPR